MSYGKCPYCGAPGITRERRLNGDDRCMNGHIYPSRCAITDENFVVPSLTYLRQRIDALQSDLAAANKRVAELEAIIESNAQEIRTTWRAARDANGQQSAFYILERMVDRIGYGRKETIPAPTPGEGGGRC